MNLAVMPDTLVQLNAHCSETQTNDNEQTDAATTPSSTCDRFEGGLGI
jgi:hypothetical protein